MKKPGILVVGQRFKGDSGTTYEVQETYVVALDNEYKGTKYTYEGFLKFDWAHMKSANNITDW